MPVEQHIPFHEIMNRWAEVPRDEVWVHCAAGYRASVVASILAARGYRVVSIDEDFERSRETNLTIV